MFGNNPTDLARLLGGLHASVKPRVFVSYHHDNDQVWYDQFSKLFADVYDLITDSSLDREIDSDDPEYVERRIREKFIKGTSVTVVICGTQTAKRKYVDWEICASLYLKHGLLGVVTPDAQQEAQKTANILGMLGRRGGWGQCLQSPPRLKDNLDSGYAHWIQWTQNPVFLRSSIQKARQLSQHQANNQNSRIKMKKNQS